VKDRITHVKQGWISYLQSLETTLLENLQKQKDKVVGNVQEEMLETKQIEEHTTKLKDTCTGCYRYKPVVENDSDHIVLSCHYLLLLGHLYLPRHAGI
jgi:hypothetical protein